MHTKVAVGGNKNSYNHMMPTERAVAGIAPTKRIWQKLFVHEALQVKRL